MTRRETRTMSAERISAIFERVKRREGVEVHTSDSSPWRFILLPGRKAVVGHQNSTNNQLRVWNFHLPMKGDPQFVFKSVIGQEANLTIRSMSDKIETTTGRHHVSDPETFLSFLASLLTSEGATSDPNT